ncbi:MAG: hypothetical protein M3Q58_17155 [Bacteroidota bacterium]|nr:hypothetical protein [Bacteroidota bacterium]
MSSFIKTLGIIIIILFPMIFLLVSIGTGNSRYFLYALSASLAAICTAYILKWIGRN